MISRFQVVDPNSGTVFDVVELQMTEVPPAESEQAKTETRFELAAAAGFPLSRINSDTFRIAHANLLVRKI